jgi:hypothetical protein
MSLSVVRKELNLDDENQVSLWPKLMKERVVLLATQAREKAKDMDASEIVANSDLLTAFNGIRSGICKPAPRKPAPRKRDDIPGDPFSQTVCIQAPSAVFRGMPVKHRIRS